jgi:hypothetical protein
MESRDELCRMPPKLPRDKAAHHLVHGADSPPNDEQRRIPDLEPLPSMDAS